MNTQEAREAAVMLRDDTLAIGDKDMNRIAGLLESMAGKLEEIESFAASLLQKDARRLRAILERP